MFKLKVTPKEEFFSSDPPFPPGFLELSIPPRHPPSPPPPSGENFQFAIRWGVCTFFWNNPLTSLVYSFSGFHIFKVYSSLSSPVKFQPHLYFVFQLVK